MTPAPCYEYYFGLSNLTRCSYGKCFFPILPAVIASFFQGTFGLGMKYVRPLAWEAWWLLYSAVAMIVVPVLWAAIAVPGLWQGIAEAPSSSVWSGAFSGFLWGVGGILFGLSVGYVGMSLTYGIVMGLAASVGSLGPRAVPRAYYYVRVWQGPGEWAWTSPLWVNNTRNAGRK